jgi:hypothetical protein
MQIGRFAKQFHYSMIAFILMGVCSWRATAQDGHSHNSTAAQTELTQDQKNLVEIVRKNTERFKDVAQAGREGYSLLFGCVTGPDAGAMGLHFVNMGILGEVNKTGIFDPARPQIILYEPASNGGFRLTGADYVVFANEWDAKHPNDPPQLLGQRFHYFETPNRFGLPAFYTLHVWAWKDNPNGAFVNWHPSLSCEQFVGTTTAPPQ